MKAPKHCYSIQFYYPGPKGLFDIEGDASMACVQADILAEEALDASGLEFQHQYAFPDGSLYKYVRTTRTPEEVLEVVNEALAEIGAIAKDMKVVTVTPVTLPITPWSKSE